MFQFHVKMTVAYDGTQFSGFQFQPKFRTIQGVLESKLSKLMGEHIQVMGSSRTDAGVHARGQVVKASYNRPIPPERLKTVLNKVLPSDIAIVDVESSDEAFHAIMDTKSKIYEYKLLVNRDPDPMRANYTWRIYKPLNLNDMRVACTYLVGEHDFAAFCASGSTVRSTIRTLYSIDIQETEEGYSLFFHGNGFLYNMVRILTATLVQVGHGELPPLALKGILESCDRTKAPWTAPATGLYLSRVFYE